MIALISLALAIALGCALVYRTTPCLTAIEPRWASALIVFGAGTAAKIFSMPVNPAIGDR